MKKSRSDLRLELIPIFLNVLSFALGFIFYGGRAAPLEKSGADKYGEDWGLILGCAEWIIPALALGGYLLLALGSWAMARVQDPVRDWNALLRKMGRPAVEDPERKEAARTRFLAVLFLLRVALQVLGLAAQWLYFSMVIGKMGMGHL